MRRIKIPPDHVVEYAYLRLFPASTRRLLLRGRRVRYSGAPDWFNLVQQLGSHLYGILEAIIAAYIYERWRSRANRKTLVLTDVLERVPEGDVVTYQYLLRKADLLVKSRDSTRPEAVIRIIEKHRTVESALSDAATAEKFLLPILEETTTSSKSGQRKFTHKYEDR